MEVNYRVKNFSLTEGAKEAISKKLDKMCELFKEDTVFSVYILKRDKDYKCEIKVQKGKDFVRSEEIGKTIEFSVDNALNTLKKRTRKIKSMRITKKRGNSTLSLKHTPLIEELNSMEDVDLTDYKIERRKYFNVDEVTEEEAMLALESLNHSFYIFKNKDLDGKVCVVYRRNVGYGLIETNI